MNARQPAESSAFALSRFTEIVSDLRNTLEHLNELEQQMEDTLNDMKAQGESRERLLVGRAMLNDLRNILARASAYCPAAQTEGKRSGERLAV